MAKIGSSSIQVIDRVAALLDAIAAHPEPASLKRWLMAKYWALAALLAVALLVFYFVDVFVEMLSLPGAATFISN